MSATPPDRSADPGQAEPAQAGPVGFIGIGAMGRPMVAALRRAGWAVHVCDADAVRAAQAAADTGAQACATPSEVAQACAVVITMLPDSAAVGAVVQGAQGLLDGWGRRGGPEDGRQAPVLVDMSSGQPERTRQIAALLQAAGVQMVDAPVSGGVPRARTAELAIMFGGEDAQLARLAPMLRAMGSSVSPTGALGTAHAMKALNNLVSAAGFLIGVEALLIGRQAGLDPAVMVDVLNASTGMNNSTQKKFRQFVLSRRFDSGFGLDLMVKDLGIALGVAEAGEVPAPFARLCRERWAGAAAALGPGQDHTDLARFVEQEAAAEPLVAGLTVPTSPTSPSGSRG